MISKAFSTEIDYGDVPENMDEEQMRAYLALESKLVMPNQKRRDSFEQQWNSGREKFQPNAEPNSPPNAQTKANANGLEQAQSPQSNVGSPFSYQPSYQTSQASHASHRQQMPPQQAGPHTHRTQSNNNQYANYGARNTTMSSTHSSKMVSPTNSTYVTNSGYDPNQIDRMSTVTIVSEKGKHRKEYSFAKVPVNANGQPQPAYVQHAHHSKSPPNTQFPYNPNLPLNERPQQRPAPKSALTAQIGPQKHHLANQGSGEQSGVIQSRNPEGKMVIKQLPYSKKTHVMVNVWVEIKEDHVEQIIVYFNKHLTVQQFLDLLKNETNNAAFKDTQLEMFCADADGDIDDDFPAPEGNAILSNLGLKNFYIKLSGASDDQIENIRRSTLAHKKQLLSTEEAEKMHSFNEDADDDEEEYEDDEDEEDGGCKCVIL
eukprot:CAMPEP_0197037604 /NCGR_PEP_ID=MMETSP1384-20130603/14767_1 /TAXON_ID=29189 /ORGANISM="Ammonia sp." /LENGTH=429 /DNA_ID=CAMNT_0042467925 /DNA_START=77 /DNA_END=1366 /DNA_ORIENTATION=+